MGGDKESPGSRRGSRPKKPLADALREQYKEVLKEPVPERLKQLIDALKAKEQKDRD